MGTKFGTHAKITEIIMFLCGDSKFIKKTLKKKIETYPVGKTDND